MSTRRGEDRSEDMIGVESDERRGEDVRERMRKYEWIDQRGRQGAMNGRKAIRTKCTMSDEWVVMKDQARRRR